MFSLRSENAAKPPPTVEQILSYSFAYIDMGMGRISTDQAKIKKLAAKQARVGEKLSYCAPAAPSCFISCFIANLRYPTFHPPEPNANAGRKRITLLANGSWAWITLLTYFQKRVIMLSSRARRSAALLCAH